MTRSARAIGATEPRGVRVRIFHLGNTARRTPVRSCERGDVDRQLLVADVTVAETVAATFASPEIRCRPEAKQSPGRPEASHVPVMRPREPEQTRAMVTDRR